MSTDRELLDLAAKAAGAEWSDYPDRTPNHWTMEKPDGVWSDWNPLTDDGDALRLAVKLRIDIEHMAMEVFAAKGPALCFIEPNDEPYSATRRAIVRAAAEIGRAMS